jgi:leucine-rich repeat kinase 1
MLRVLCRPSPLSLRGMLRVLSVSSFEPKRNAKSERRRTTVIYSFAGTGSQQRHRCSTFRVRRSQTIYWREGLLVTFDGGYLR